MQKPAGCPQTPQIAAALGETASVPLQGHVDFKRLLRERYFSPGTEVDADAPVVGRRDRSASHPHCGSLPRRCEDAVDIAGSVPLPGLSIRRARDPLRQSRRSPTTPVAESGSLISCAIHAAIGAMVVCRSPQPLHVAIMIKHEKTNGGRQIAVDAFRIDRGNHSRQGRIAPRRDLLECIPERIFEADAGLMTPNNDRPLDDKRFHADPLPTFPQEDCSIRHSNGYHTQVYRYMFVD
jgi:hypothetical protein